MKITLTERDDEMRGDVLTLEQGVLYEARPDPESTDPGERSVAFVVDYAGRLDSVWMVVLTVQSDGSFKSELIQKFYNEPWPFLIAARSTKIQIEA